MYRKSGDKEKICQLLGYRFNNEKLLLQALTRRSALNEGVQTNDIKDYQRLEFIGDRVLNLVISGILFDNHPDWQEGHLTQALNKYTHNKGPLALVAKQLKLDEFLVVGVGEERLNIRENTKALSDALEALIGAIWIDSDNDFAFLKRLIRSQFKSLGLLDFNEEYKEQTIRMGLKKAYNDTMELALPEFHESRGMTLAEILHQARMKKQATKPLSGLAASFEKFLNYQSASDSEEETQPEQVEEEKQVVRIEAKILKRFS